MNNSPCNIYCSDRIVFALSIIVFFFHVKTFLNSINETHNIHTVEIVSKITNKSQEFQILKKLQRFVFLFFNREKENQDVRQKFL